MLGALGALAVTLGLLFVGLHLLRRIHGVRVPGRGIPLEILQRVPTGPRQGVALLRVDDRVLVVSVAEKGCTLLTELSAASASKALAAQRLADHGDDARRVARPLANARMSAELERLTAFARRLIPLIVLAFLAVATSGQAQSSATRNPAQPVARAAALDSALKPSSTVVNVAPFSPAPARRPTTVPGAPAIQGPTVNGPETPKIDFRIGEGAEQVHLTGTVGLVVFMGALTLLPAVFLLMTSFTRILIVLHFLRSAIGTQTTPPGQLLVALAVLLTGVVMHPIVERANTEAIQPYFDGKISQADAYKTVLVPMREFMLANTRDQDVAAFAEMSGVADVDSVEALPTVTIVAAFVTSELRTAFQMGFVIFLPFVVVDLIVASVLMSMGMFMLPPAMVSLPFKLLLFVLADGWTLVVKNLLGSFHGVPS
jgi:flagellar biosynthesis protein FliP